MQFIKHFGKWTLIADGPGCQDILRHCQLRTRCLKVACLEIDNSVYCLPGSNGESVTVLLNYDIKHKHIHTSCTYILVYIHVDTVSQKTSVCLLL